MLWKKWKRHNTLTNVFQILWSTHFVWPVRNSFDSFPKCFGWLIMITLLTLSKFFKIHFYHHLTSFLTVDFIDRIYECIFIWAEVSLVMQNSNIKRIKCCGKDIISSSIFRCNITPLSIIIVYFIRNVSDSDINASFWFGLVRFAGRKREKKRKKTIMSQLCNCHLVRHNNKFIRIFAFYFANNWVN